MEILNTIILLGALQGFILSIILFFSKAHPGTKFLAGFLFVLAYNGLETYSWSSGHDFLFFSLFPFVVIFAAGPCLYFYLRLLREPEKTISCKSVALHFSPVFALGLFRIILFFLHWHALSSKSYLTVTLYSIEVWFATFTEPMSLVAFLVYLNMSRQYFKFARRSRTQTDTGQAIADTWAKQLLWSMILIAVTWVITIVLPRLLSWDDPQDIQYYPIEMMLVLLVYWISFAGYHRKKIVFEKTAKATAAIDSKLAENCEHLLRKAMSVDKLYQDPALTVAKVATHLQMPQKMISAVVNQHIGQSFNDFVNNYRVADIKERLLSHQDDHLTIAGIALECGFNSQATFQRAFKSIVQCSPSEFIALHTKKAADIQK
ncbi:helix-turn-helix domain-containing protein [Pseudochryseolinea flava]|uniref:HTH araC/xylS-type domain-containing protein n=1 Tax=Pseudochryseolinea flava TaxID=2059302 RepID=A0A364Y2E1_9BACT|nr:helix-turn-helix domain-containing protein [Pseudochryseolinea flava]RAW00130.1 hypothetical protein DQQ10_16410 [Pseudochryseolinea flava]